MYDKEESKQIEETLEEFLTEFRLWCQGELGDKTKMLGSAVRLRGTILTTQEYEELLSSTESSPMKKMDEVYVRIDSAIEEMKELNQDFVKSIIFGGEFEKFKALKNRCYRAIGVIGVCMVLTIFSVRTEDAVFANYSLAAIIFLLSLAGFELYKASDFFR